jgi:extradiol dioxygenase family protein
MIAASIASRLVTSRVLPDNAGSLADCATTEPPMSPALAPFHLAIPVQDLGAARAFYGEVFGCAEGRSSEHWVDFDFFGHQLVVHLDRGAAPAVRTRNAVDGKDVPVPHFGVVLTWDDWQALASRLRSRGTEFVIEPYVRFAGQVGEQATFFLYDPSGNALEFKAFRDPSRLFAR